MLQIRPIPRMHCLLYHFPIGTKTSHYEFPFGKGFNPGCIGKMWIIKIFVVTHFECGKGVRKNPIVRERCKKGITSIRRWGLRRLEIWNIDSPIVDMKSKTILSHNKQSRQHIQPISWDYGSGSIQGGLTFLGEHDKRFKYWRPHSGHKFTIMNPGYLFSIMWNVVSFCLPSIYILIHRNC